MSKPQKKSLETEKCKLLKTKRYQKCIHRDKKVIKCAHHHLMKKNVKILNKKKKLWQISQNAENRLNKKIA